MASRRLTKPAGRTAYTRNEAETSSQQAAALLAIELAAISTDMLTLSRWSAVDRAWRFCVSHVIQSVGVSIVSLQYGFAELGVAEWCQHGDDQVRVYQKWRRWLYPLMQEMPRPSRPLPSPRPSLGSAVSGASVSRCGSAAARRRSSRLTRLLDRRKLQATKDTAAWARGILQSRAKQQLRPLLVIAAVELIAVARSIAHALEASGVAVSVCVADPLLKGQVLTALGKAFPSSRYCPTADVVDPSPGEEGVAQGCCNIS